MKTLAVLFIISLLFLAGGCSENSIPVSSVDENITLSKVPVPFKVSMEGFSTVIPTSPTVGTTLFEISGSGTHVGKYTAIGTCDYQLTSPTTGVAFNGVLNIVSASGDELNALYTGSWIINSEGLYDYTLNLDFNGGTGRFEGTTGEVTALAVGRNIDPINPLYKTVTGEGNGWILFK
jgi:hypothetical protein